MRGSVVLALLLACRPESTGSFSYHECNTPLGMESGKILDTDITASSSYDLGTVGPHRGRLKLESNGGAWCPKGVVSNDGRQYLEVNLQDVHAVTAIKSQGRYNNGSAKEFVEEMMIDYWRQGFSKWVRWKGRDGKQVLQANRDTNTIVERPLVPVIVASKIRLVPYSGHPRMVCLRVEIVGCYHYEGVISYSVIQGDIKDVGYDGREEGGVLIGGIGQLCDGRHGVDQPFVKKYNEWVGWKNDTMGYGSSVEMTFEFDSVRNFTALYMYSNNDFRQGVQVFSHAKAYFSVGGEHFFPEPVSYTYPADTIMPEARNVTVKLHHRTGRFLKLQLFFANKWMLISEISFESVVLPGIWPVEEAEDPLIFFPDDNSVKSNGGIEIQRDEVKSPDHKDERNTPVGGGSRQSKNGETFNMDSSVGGISDGVSSSNNGGGGGGRRLIGLLVGALTAATMLAGAAVAFVMVRRRRLLLDTVARRRSSSFQDCAADKPHLPPPIHLTELPVRVNANGHVYGQVDLDDDSDKSNSNYHRPYGGGSARRPSVLLSPDYTDVRDIVAQEEYAIPHVHQPSKTLTGHRSQLSIHDEMLPKHTMEKYYAASDVCQINAPPPPRSPPPTSSRSSSSRGGGASNASTCPLTRSDDTLCQFPPEFPRDNLSIIQTLTKTHFGEIHLCEIKSFPDELLQMTSVKCKLVTVKSLRKGVSESTKHDFYDEVESLWKIRDPNITKVLGCCLSEEPFCIINEFMQHGDLNQFLQEHVAVTAAPLPPYAKTLSYGCLMHMATQIASGMKYLEVINFVHRDLSARNCLVGPNYTVKVSNMSLSKSVYSADYFDFEGRLSLPIRWMAWESVLLNKHTPRSDVWSFAVTLWEILTFAREQPYDELSDQHVVDNITRLYQNDVNFVLLPQPINCPKEIYDLMCECWQRDDKSRPNFREIHLFLQRKNLGYKPECDP
ncbi:discoidin domain-containing receptor 2 [Adelges cooleyi]|uniref:discoidin domain-containing receptor 2 n=1 Tax=Adelges cooleyi TaxID=133065 RepID=UPI00217F4DD4|nr:discoidin domain-containing receptor 2 [Adelges cooleyi]XP_050425446.1 discoidin domain-containing receptor 2 [Adelges cooleyi]